MRVLEGATDNKPRQRRKNNRQKNNYDRQSKRDAVVRQRPTKSLHERRELLRIEELEEENYDTDDER